MNETMKSVSQPLTFGRESGKTKAAPAPPHSFVNGCGQSRSFAVDAPFAVDALGESA